MRLVEELTARGLSIATIKHAHHTLRLDEKGTDSARHRAAGAKQVAVVSERRWALMREGPEPDFVDVVAQLEPCDLIVVEGYKSQPISKIEARRRESHPGAGLAEIDSRVIAIAADYAIESDRVSVFELDDITSVADFVVATFEIATSGRA